ncbi:MAG TPA: toll/interleukin-1 receptor domain-containing protein [Sedimentisphaerales bacterium]|nr:toll/interleukin-1 receptor domain-containing protein [Sedimentisphaerales bacterium]
MIILYHGTGSQNFELVDERLSSDVLETLYVNIRALLKTRGYSKALEFFESIPFSIWNGTNDFEDEFSLFYAETPLLQYEAIKSVSSYPDVKNAFRQLAEVTREIGPYVRFIAIDLLHAKSDEWDVFICHASADKDEVARPLATILESFGLRVWLDENELKLGDSVRSTIDHALAKSKYGIVVLSKAFFDRDRPHQIIAYRRAVTLDMEMRKTGNNEKAKAAINECNEVLRLLSKDHE